MNLIFMTVISMSLSGMLLILALLPGGRLLKGKLGRQWQYYIWLVVVIRLFLPFGPEASLMGQVHRVAEQAIV
ncbi:MAG: M56 family metallopeptidase, partial [Schaedlerella sp.]|uniref:M56 family metallopeptidase n=1 Tax=Schaedlerella sp. TaxID=2676057 RepID=UPI00352736BA